jgi:hypothetical protein
LAINPLETKIHVINIYKICVPTTVDGGGRGLAFVTLGILKETIVTEKERNTLKY